jgi:DNA-binding XRE family transcriptional regulator
VSNARGQGWTWQAIAAALGVRRQSVHKKHAGRV